MVGREGDEEKGEWKLRKRIVKHRRCILIKGLGVLVVQREERIGKNKNRRQH